MKLKSMIPWKAAWVLGLLWMVACSGASSQPSGAAPDATLSAQTFKAGDCTLLIQGVQLSDRYPMGCETGSKNCLTMDNGEQLLLVFFKSQGSCDMESLADKVAFEKELYLLATDGTRSERLITGIEGGVLGLGFSLASPSNNLVLVWGTNPTVKLPAIIP
jgi:hypothetical protein